MDQFIQVLNESGFPVFAVLALGAYIYWQTVYIRGISREHRDDYKEITNSFTKVLIETKDLQAKHNVALDNIIDTQKKITDRIYSTGK